MSLRNSEKNIQQRPDTGPKRHQLIHLLFNRNGLIGRKAVKKLCVRKGNREKCAVLHV